MNRELVTEEGKLYIKMSLYKEGMEKSDALSEYECNILEVSHILGLARMLKKSINGESYLFFSLHNYISLEERFARTSLDVDLLCNFFEDLSRLYENMRIYLLDKNIICLEPEYIFFDEKEGHYVFLPIAESENSGFEKYEELLTFFADSCSVEKKDLLEFIFEMFSFSNGENFDEICFLKDVSGYKYRMRAEEEAENVYVDERFDEEDEEIKDEKIKIRGTFIISMLLLFLSFWFAYVCNDEFKYNVISIAAMVLAVGITGYEVLKVTNHLPKQIDI